MVERYSLAFALASGALLAACYGPNAPQGAPCEKETDCPSGQSCDPETSRCGPPSGFTTWIDDSAEDFAGGAATSQVAIEPGGFVGPAAYFRDGLRVSGVDDIAIPDAATTWNEVAAFARTGTTFVRASQINVNVGEVPLGTGLMRSDGISLIVEGEILLDEVGTWTLELSTDERAFLDMAPPDGTVFERIVTAATGGKQRGTYTVRVPGWHRLRGAIIDVTGGISYDLKAGEPGQANPNDISVDELRAPASDARGSFVDGFDDPFLLRSASSAVDALGLDGRVFDNAPLGMPLGSSNMYSLRFTSQVLIDVDGSYALRVASSQGHRVFIDGQLESDIAKWDGNPTDAVTITRPIQLDPGWHDLVVDLNRSSASDATLDVTVESGPAWAGQRIPVDHMRPVVPRSARWSGATSTFTTAAIPDNSFVQRSVPGLGVPGGFTVSRINVGFQLTHSSLSQVSARLGLGNGSSVTVFSAGAVTGSGSHFRYVPLQPNTAGVNAWTVTATDTLLDSVGGQLNYAAGTLEGTAGQPPYADSYSYTSAPREIGDVESFAYVRWELRQERPTTEVTVSLRTCETAAACEGEPWTPVARGAVPEVMPRRFAQYQVQLAATGDVPTALDWIEIAYRSAVK